MIYLRCRLDWKWWQMHCFTPLYIRFGNWHGEYLEQSTTKMMQNRNNNLVNAKTEMRWRGRTKDWKLEPNLAWNAWLNRSKYEIVVLRQTSLFILHYLMIGQSLMKMHSRFRINIFNTRIKSATQIDTTSIPSLPCVLMRMRVTTSYVKRRS